MQLERLAVRDPLGRELTQGSGKPAIHGGEVSWLGRDRPPRAGILEDLDPANERLCAAVSTLGK